ncbi:MAG: hypothetical protein LC804_05700 [Acidobacteria bacterium]|nr:hypothetical protein [Acidobacteriota bacterium]
MLIRPLSRCHPGLFDYWDGNWIDCELEIVAGGFRGGFRADLRSEEFYTFLQEVEGLTRAVQGTASFATMEGRIALSLTGDGNGHIRVAGDAIDVAGTGNRLQFGFDTDQTYLPPICRSLEHLLAAFPVTGTADN